jgi:hypothetical protein
VCRVVAAVPLDHYVSRTGDRLKIKDVQVVGKPLVRATAADVDALASRLWITFPSGYREYVTRLGEGTLGGSFVRIYPPWRSRRS